MEYVGEDVEGPSRVLIAAGIIVVIGIILFVLISIFYKPSSKEEGNEDLQDIGGPSKYAPGRGPLGPERGRRGPPDRVRGGRVERERGGMRRASPRPESMEQAHRGRDVRRAPAAPDHLRPGGRQREVRRAPPRRYQ